MRIVDVRRISFIALMSLTAGLGGMCPGVHAQVTTSELFGKAADDQGNPAADVEIVAKNQETGAYQITYTGERGEYSIHYLDPGTYQVMARHPNFAPFTKKDIHLLVGLTTVVDFKLTRKEVQEKEIVVEAEAPLIDVKKSDLSVVVEPEQIQSLPLNSRNFLELAMVAPGAKTSTQGRGPVTTGALNSRFISAYIDGVDFKNDDLGGVVGTSFGFTSNIVPEDAIREFEVITSMYKAEYAKASNGVVNAITKEGGNEFHGSAFGLFRTEDLNAHGPFENVANPITGKVKPDYNRQQYGFSLGGPISLDRTHFFFALERNSINNFNTVYTSGRQTSLDGAYKSPTTENELLGSLTHHFNGDNSASVRLLDISTDNTPGNFGGVFTYSNGFDLSFRLTTVQAEDRWLIGKNTINVLRLNYQRYRKFATPNSSDPEHIYLSSGIYTGWNDVQPQTEEQDKYQLRDDVEQSVSDMLGTHAFKGGVTLTRERFASAAAFSSGGVFTFRSDTSALPFQGAIGVGNPTTSAYNTEFGIYAQDEWTVLSNVTLNLGLRWDFETNMINNDYVNPFANDTALTNHVPAQFIGRGNRDIDYGQIAPRLGFAWDIFNDRLTVLHGGFGIFYDRMIWNFPSNELQNGRYNIYTVVFGPNAPATLSREVLADYINRQIGGAPAPGVVLFPSSLPTPHTRQWTVGVSRQLTPSIAMSLDYINIRGTDEYTTYNINYRKGLTGPRVTTPRYGAINLVTAAGQSWYDGVQFGVSKPYHNDWQMQFSYTLSWAFNTFDDPFSNYVFQSSVLRSPSLQDERHRLTLSGLVDLPLDIQLSGIVSLSSPRPIAVITGTDDNQDGTVLDDFPLSGRNSARPNPGKIRNWLKNVDLRVMKYFPLMSGMKIAVIADAYNVFNWSNFTGYVNRLNLTSGGVSVFGTPNLALNPRQIQVGARVIF